MPLITRLEYEMDGGMENGNRTVNTTVNTQLQLTRVTGSTQSRLNHLVYLCYLIGTAEAF